jgi:hypothetical protein
VKLTALFFVLYGVTTAALPADASPRQPRRGGQSGSGKHRYGLDLRAHFFQHATGKIDVEDATRVGGWNVFLRSEVVLVLVTISGPSFPIGDGASLELVARSGRQRLERKWISLRRGYFSETGRATIPFLIPGAGLCTTIEVFAELRIRGERQKIRREIPLACGE